MQSEKQDKSLHNQNKSNSKDKSKVEYEYDMPSLGDQIYQTIHPDAAVPTGNRVLKAVDKDSDDIHKGDMPGLGDIIANSLHPPDPQTGECIVHSPKTSPRNSPTPHRR